jgi:hypothetical protein
MLRIFLIVLIFSCRDNNKNENVPEPSFYPIQTGKLKDTTITIELQYVGFFCQCAQWITADDYVRFKDSGNIQKRTIFIEPINEDFRLPDTIGYPGDMIRITGQFYENKGYPKYYPITEMKVDSARVFRYEKYQILNSNHKNYVSSP